MEGGFGNDYARNIKIEQCRVHSITCTSFANSLGGCNGITLYRVTQALLSDLVVSDIKSNDASCCVFIGDVRGLKLNRSFFSSVYGDRNANGIDSMLLVPNYDLTFEDLDIFDIISLRNEALGFEVNGYNIIAKRMNVYNVSVLASSNSNRAVGILAQHDSGYFEDCTVINVTFSGTTLRPEAHAAGFEALAGNKLNTFKNCIAKNISTLGVALYSAGFSDITGTGNMWIDCISDNVFALSTNTVVSGFLLNGTSRSTVKESISKESAGSGSNSVLGTDGQGISVISTANTLTIENNRVLHNRGVGINDQSTGIDSNAYYRNVAKKNTPNYSNTLILQPIPRAVWIIGSVPPSVDNLQNLDVN